MELELHFAVRGGLCAVPYLFRVLIQEVVNSHICTFLNWAEAVHIGLYTKLVVLTITKLKKKGLLWFESMKTFTQTVSSIRNNLCWHIFLYSYICSSQLKAAKMSFFTIKKDNHIQQGLSNNSYIYLKPLCK